MDKLFKIVVIGPESTGKSTLCEKLADHFHTIWCREYARDFLLEHGTHYSFDDLLIIAKGQLGLEDAAVEELNNTSDQQMEHKKILFLDTDMYVMKVWCEYVFDKCHPFVLQQILERKYDGYLLCKPDLPWVKDELREYPDFQTREKLYHHYRDLLVNQSVPWFEVSGEGHNRTQAAIDWVHELVSK